MFDRVSESILFANRELSYLAYNQRIIDEAADPSVPLLERLKFAAIVGENLDTFFMVRVAGLKQQIKSEVLEAGPDGLLPSEQLPQILECASQQVDAQERVLVDQILPALRDEGIVLARIDELPSDAQNRLKVRFEQDIFPMLTPLAVDPGHPFPFLKNQRLNLAVHLAPVSHPEVAKVPLLAVVQVPSLVPRFLRLDVKGQIAVVGIEDLITHHMGQLFHGMRIIECVPFRVIRNWELPLEDDDHDDLLATVRKELQNRWRNDAVRLEIGAEASPSLRKRLTKALDLETSDVQRHRGPLATGALLTLVEAVGRADLRDDFFQPVPSPSFSNGRSIFETVAAGDVLLHHPYESYEPVIDLLRVAASDPQVQAIKQTLYRVNRNSPLLEYLTRAAESGKQVTALVELKARFDEETSLEWAQALEEAGVHVVYGSARLKTHCKVTMVVRREADGVRRYVHLGTGNYNEAAAARYADLSFFTARPEIGDDVAELFNLLTGYSASPAWRKLVVAPLDLRRRLVEHIERTAEVARQGRPAKIVFKSNALIDVDTTRALCAASQAGVETTLLIRGPCTLKIGVPEVSDRIRVQMVIDRFLEHSRLFYFKRDTQEDVFLTSTDVMHRNLDWRIEVMVPIEDEAIKRRIVDEILATELSDTAKAAYLGADGRYHRVAANAKDAEPNSLGSADSAPLVRSQARFIAAARAVAQSEMSGDEYAEAPAVTDIDSTQRRT